MENTSSLVLIVSGIFFLILAYSLGKNAGKAILFVRELIKQITDMNRPEKP